MLFNSNLVAELIMKGDFHAVHEAMEKSLAEGSITFEEAIALMVRDGVVSRDEGLSHADSVTNLVWRLQNDATPVSRVSLKREETGKLFPTTDRARTVLDALFRATKEAGASIVTYSMHAYCPASTGWLYLFL